MSLIGNGEGHTLVILTDAESRLIRKYLTEVGGDFAAEVRVAFNRGIARGTARLQQEFKDEQARKMGKK